MVTDPVCRMQVDETTATHTTEHQGQRYYFCCSMCKEKFEQAPQRYLDTLQQPDSSQ